MSLNSTIRNVRFAQGVEISLPIDVLDTSGEVEIPNNSSNVNTGIKINSDRAGGAEISLLIRRFTNGGGERIENITYRIVNVPSAVNPNDKWILVRPYKSDEGISTEVTFSLSVSGNEVTALASSSLLSGTGHKCTIYYRVSLFNKI